MTLLTRTLPAMLHPSVACSLILSLHPSETHCAIRPRCNECQRQATRARALLDDKTVLLTHLFDCIRVDETPASSNVGFPDFVARVTASRVRSIRRGCSAVTRSACESVPKVQQQRIRVKPRGKTARFGKQKLEEARKHGTHSTPSPFASRSVPHRPRAPCPWSPPRSASRPPSSGS